MWEVLDQLDYRASEVLQEDLENLEFQAGMVNLGNLGRMVRMENQDQ